MENNMEMNFSMEGLDKLIEDTEKAMKATQTNDEKMKQFKEIIEGVARKYFSFGKEGARYLSEEDAVQELWVRILELIRDCGGVEYTDSELVARICFNKAVDMFRFYHRRYHSKAEYIEGTEERYDNGSLGVNYFEALKSDKFIRAYDLVLIKEVIDIFEIGSRKRKYAVMKLVNNGVLRKMDLDPWDQALVETPKTDDEEGYIHCLGYKSHCPGSWTCQKREMKEAILKFLDLD